MNPSAHPRLRILAFVLVALGAALSLSSLLGERGLRRFAFDYLWGFGFLWCIVLGSLFFVALHHVSGAVWSALVRRVAEMFAAAVPVVALLFAPLVLLALLPGAGLYPWMDSEIVRGDHLLEGKAPYLNFPFFALRALLFFTLWFLYARFFVGRSLRQDAGIEIEESHRRMRLGATHFMVVFAFSISFAALDWFKSLDPHWYSTIYGVYIWSGMVVAALAAITLAVLWLNDRGRLGDSLLRSDHLYNLGALLFAFTCFWGYIAFSQYMLIWYGNLPEETIYYAHRLEHGWLPLSLILGLMRFVLPFALLLSRRAKTSPRVLVAASLLVLAGQWLDLYWLIMPQFDTSSGPLFGLPELGPPLLMSGVLLLWMARFGARHAMVASRDPVFDRSCEFQL